MGERIHLMTRVSVDWFYRYCFFLRVDIVDTRLADDAFSNRAAHFVFSVCSVAESAVRLFRAHRSFHQHDYADT